MENLDMEKLNRENFKSMMDALSMPGKITTILPIFDSTLLGTANVLLYNEVSFSYDGIEDMSLIEAIANPKQTTTNKADYIFSDVLNENLIDIAKKGDYLNPDFSATLIFKCDDFNKTNVKITGPGINGKKTINLPCNKEFVKVLMNKNEEYPLGVDVFFINSVGEILALSRTTKVEVR